MNIIEINGVEFKAFIKWSEITLPRFVSLCRVEIPEKLTALWKAEHGSEDWDKALKDITESEIKESFPKYYKDVILCLTDINEALLDFIGEENVNKIYYDLLHPVALSSILNMPFIKKEGEIQPYELTKDKYFTHEGEDYYYPDSVNIAGVDIPLGNEPIVSFVEAGDIAKAWKDMALNGFENISLLAGIYCRKKGEKYDQTKAIERAKMFQTLTMDIYWRLFFLQSKTHEELSKRYPIIYGSVRTEKEKKSSLATELDSFGGWGLMFEVAKDMVFGSIESVKLVNLYDFYHYVAYSRTLTKYMNDVK